MVFSANAKVQDVRKMELNRFAADTLAILSHALEINPDEAVVIDWFKNLPLPDFQNKTPAGLVAAGEAETLTHLHWNSGLTRAIFPATTGSVGRTIGASRLGSRRFECFVTLSNQ
jgi:hypothetical protein